MQRISEITPWRDRKVVIETGKGRCILISYDIAELLEHDQDQIDAAKLANNAIRMMIERGNYDSSI